MKLLKNPVFIGLVLFAGGMGLGAWGWIKNESTIASHTHGAVTMIVIGCAMIVAGLIIWATASSNKGQ